MPELVQDVRSAAEVLGAMITPAFLISASGTLVLSTSNRLSRVVDRVRTLSRDVEAAREPSSVPDRDGKLAMLGRQLHALARRALMLQSALTALYTAIGFLVATSVGMALLTLLDFGSGWPPVALAMLGALALLWASFLLVREARLAIGSTMEEMSYVERIISTSLVPPAQAQGRGASAP